MDHQMQSNQRSPVLRPWILILLVLVILAAAGYWWFSRNKTSVPIPTPTLSTTPTLSLTPSPLATPSKSPSPTATPLSYTDNTYNFSFTYPSSWGACKIKEQKIDGSQMTFYVNCPTKDQTFAAGDNLQFPGYYSPFAFSAFTAAQWTAAQASEGPKESLLKQGNTYTFGWSQANGQLPSDWTNKQLNDYQKILDTFTVN